MAELKKEDTLFMRDEKGELIPQRIVLETIPDKPEVLVTPMTRGEIQKISALNIDTNKDEDIILQHCISPKYTEDEVKALKPNIAGAIITAILSISLDVSQQQITSMAEKQVQQNFLQRST